MGSWSLWDSQAAPLTPQSVIDAVNASPGVVKNITGNPAAIWSAWCSAAFDGQNVYYMGGGHGDYGGNEVFRYGVVDKTYERLNDPAPLVRAIGSDGYPAFADGPPANHTYDGLDWHPQLGLMVMSNMTTAFDNGTENPPGCFGGIYAFDPATLQWQGPYGPETNGFARSWITLAGEVAGFIGTNASSWGTLRIWDPFDGWANRTLSVGGDLPFQQPSAFAVVGGNTAGRVFTATNKGVFEIIPTLDSNGKIASVTSAEVNTQTFERYTATAPGPDGTFALYTTGNQVWTLTPNATPGGAATIVSDSPSGGPPNYGSGENARVNGKFLYCNPLGGYIVSQRYDDGHHVYRPDSTAYVTNDSELSTALGNASIDRIVMAAGTYTGPIILARDGLTVESYQATIVNVPTNGEGAIIRNNDCTVRGLLFQGDGSSDQTGVQLEAIRSNNSVLWNDTRNIRRGIRTWGGNPYPHQTNLTIENNDLRGNVPPGVENTGANAILIGATTATCRFNEARGHGDTFGCIKPDNVQDPPFVQNTNILWERNLIYYGGDDGIEMDACESAICRYNLIMNTFQSGMSAQESRGSVLGEFNVIVNCGSFPFKIKPDGSNVNQGVTFRNNTVQGPNGEAWRNNSADAIGPITIRDNVFTGDGVPTSVFKADTSDFDDLNQGTFDMGHNLWIYDGFFQYKSTLWNNFADWTANSGHGTGDVLVPGTVQASINALFINPYTSPLPALTSPVAPPDPPLSSHYALTSTYSGQNLGAVRDGDPIVRYGRQAVVPAAPAGNTQAVGAISGQATVDGIGRGITSAEGQIAGQAAVTGVSLAPPAGAPIYGGGGTRQG